MPRSASVVRMLASALQAARTNAGRTTLPIATVIPAAAKTAALTGGLGWLGLQVYSNSPRRFTVLAQSESPKKKDPKKADPPNRSKEKPGMKKASKLAAATATATATAGAGAATATPSTPDVKIEKVETKDASTTASTAVYTTVEESFGSHPPTVMERMLCNCGIPLSPPPADRSGLYGVEVNGLDETLESLVMENWSANADPQKKDDNNDEEEEAMDEEEAKKRDPMRKPLTVILEDALKMHHRMMVEQVPGKCEPSDQLAEPDFRGWVDEADRLFRERRYEVLKEKLDAEYAKTKGKYPKRDPQLLWRMARLYFLLGNEVEVNTLKSWKAALVYAMDSLKQFDDKSRIDRNRDVFYINHACCWKCHLWFGIVLAKLGGMQEDQVKRIKIGIMARQHMERAAQINPLDPIPNFALAKWHYEFCKLTAGQGKIVRELGYQYPITNIETAMRYSEKANTLSPKLLGSLTGKFPRNVYLMCEIFYILGYKEKAKYHLESLLYQLAPFCISIEDKRAVERGKLLYAKIVTPTQRNPNDITPRAGKARPHPPEYPDHHNNLFEPIVMKEDDDEGEGGDVDESEAYPPRRGRKYWRGDE